MVIIIFKSELGMWFDNAIGKEKIQSIFNNEFDIQTIEIDGFSMVNLSDLRFNLFCKNVPKKFPDKWSKNRFNALNLIITFGDVIRLDVSGSRVGLLCLPTTISFTGCSEIKVKHDVLNLYCKSKFLTIESIRPYLDERWD
ncbi:Imm50 family immunity protein [Scandinavium sp. V105_16]|uniref:Imm50 family immunity protein n=1 Tax=Scandinavium lactucae TaxID=3095028 RepID=A0AAJ2S3L3_9ENTR|nr:MULTISPECIES: Imm50 family immunity protein [unclassified Scandinavium]MDX6019826.1 Imm50 family immunity protein [Scandinavium sp. V105_16]MDX6031359.1 Imm50 family immunity protein [Scandinavium sp. V105_12]